MVWYLTACMVKALEHYFMTYICLWLIGLMENSESLLMAPWSYIWFPLTQWSPNQIFSFPVGLSAVGVEQMRPCVASVEHQMWNEWAASACQGKCLFSLTSVLPYDLIEFDVYQLDQFHCHLDYYNYIVIFLCVEGLCFITPHLPPPPPTPNPPPSPHPHPHPQPTGVTSFLH